MLDQGCSSPGFCFWSICISFAPLANSEVSRLWFQGIVGEYEFLSLKDSGTHRDRMRRFSTVCKEIALWLSKNWFVLLPQSWAVLNPRPSQELILLILPPAAGWVGKGWWPSWRVRSTNQECCSLSFFYPRPLLLCSPESYRLLLCKTRCRVRIHMPISGQWSPISRKYVLEPLQATKCFYVGWPSQC